MKNKKIYYVLLITVCAVLFTTMIGADGIRVTEYTQDIIA